MVPAATQAVHAAVDDVSRFVAGFGAAYGTAKAGVGIASMGVLRPELVMKSIVPIVMAGVLGIYGLIISVIISTGSECPHHQSHAATSAHALWRSLLPPDSLSTHVIQ